VRVVNRLPTEILSRAGELRRNQTDAESLLWFLLRNRRMDGFKFRRQQPIGPYIIDFYCATKKLAIELDGGGHADENQARYDSQRSDFLAREGIEVLRFWNNQLLGETEAVLEVIWNKLNPSSPSS
jgi:very-short-patch-repair endonuclease